MTAIKSYATGACPPVSFAMGDPNPFKGLGDQSWTTPNLDDKLDAILDSTNNNSVTPSSPKPNLEKSELITRINKQYPVQIDRIKEIKLARPCVVWTERTILVLTAALIPLVLAKLIVPLIIVGAVLMITIWIYAKMRDRISTNTEIFCTQQHRACLALANGDDLPKATERLQSFRSSYIPEPKHSPKKVEKQPTTAKEYADAYNELVATHMLGTGHSGKFF